MLLRVHREYYTQRILYNLRHLSPLPIHCIKVCAGIKEGGEGGFAKLSLHFLFELYYSHTHASLSIYFSIIFKFYFLLSPNLKKKKINNNFFSLHHLPFDRNNSQITANHHNKQIQTHKSHTQIHQSRRRLHKLSHLTLPYMVCPTIKQPD